MGGQHSSRVCGELQQDPRGSCHSAIIARNGEFGRVSAAAQGVGARAGAHVQGSHVVEGVLGGEQLVVVHGNSGAVILSLLQLRHHSVVGGGAVAGPLRPKGLGDASHVKGCAPLRGSPLGKAPLLRALLYLGFLSLLLRGGIH